jgi:hypothetical protein
MWVKPRLKASIRVIIIRITFSAEIQSAALLVEQRQLQLSTVGLLRRNPTVSKHLRVGFDSI